MNIKKFKFKHTTNFVRKTELNVHTLMSDLCFIVYKNSVAKVNDNLFNPFIQYNV